MSKPKMFLNADEIVQMMKCMRERIHQLRNKISNYVAEREEAIRLGDAERIELIKSEISKEYAEEESLYKLILKVCDEYEEI